jgi:phosphonate metabolism protein PhnN/1,5-bisphosphokinase (PRPP-forming)
MRTSRPADSMNGALVLVVGPSGAGKDTLINAARRRLAGDPRFVFARRTITREADEDIEDHDTLDREQFDLRRRCGGFALDWQAHGLSYALPVSIEAAMMVGRVVVANVSRSVIDQAFAKYPNCHVVLVTATSEARAERLARRGRESAADIAARLGREGPPLPRGLFPAIIDNSGEVADGVRRFVRELLRLAG